MLVQIRYRRLLVGTVMALKKISRSSSLESVTVFPSRTTKGFAGVIKLRALNGGVTLDYKEGSNVIGSCLQEGDRVGQNQRRCGDRGRGHGDAGP